MKKRKRIDALMWAWLQPDGRVTLSYMLRRRDAYRFRENYETVVRVRITEIRRKKRSKKQ